ncbi:MAG: 8-oxoguanine deaminase [Chloroflexi bacterium]|nr:8-oxoguanine deaminase [Chloroflexota bacterium]
MPTLLVKNATLLVTMDEGRRRIEGGGLFVRDNVIEAVGPTEELPQAADRVIVASGMIVLPGLVNTHHHLYQTLTRALPAVQDVELFDWLRTLYPLWAQLTAKAIYVSALVGLAELILSGCTTTTDHLYLFPNDVSLDDEIRAARQLGIRFHPCRGSMSLGRSQGGLPPDRVVQSEEAILADCQRVIEEYHDPQPYSMCRIVLAPCSPFSVTAELMKESAVLARRHALHLHTHVAETLDEVSFCLGKIGCRPVEYMQQLGWVGPDVSYAHAIHLNQQEIELLADTGTGVAHCPSSNMRLGSGIAPIREMLDAGVKVGLAVDGSASNDSSHLLAEVRMAMLLQRVQKGAGALSAQQALEMATLGGAAVLGRDDIGSLEAGKAADFIAIDLNRLEYAGALHDPLAALIFCAPAKVDLSVINGRIVVDGGRLGGFDLGEIVACHNRISRQMVERATT